MHFRASDYIELSSKTVSDEDETNGEIPVFIVEDRKEEDKDIGIKSLPPSSLRFATTSSSCTSQCSCRSSSTICRQIDRQARCQGTVAIQGSFASRPHQVGTRIPLTSGSALVFPSETRDRPLHTVNASLRLPEYSNLRGES